MTAPSKNTVVTTQACPLLQLPAELRNTIYNLVTTDEVQFNTNNGKVSLHPLGRASKQTQAEWIRFTDTHIQNADKITLRMTDFVHNHDCGPLPYNPDRRIILRIFLTNGFADDSAFALHDVQKVLGHCEIELYWDPRTFNVAKGRRCYKYSLWMPLWRGDTASWLVEKSRKQLWLAYEEAIERYDATDACC